jgi:putative oxidoreductase
MLGVSLEGSVVLMTKPDTKNTWMQAEIGRFDADSSPAEVTNNEGTPNMSKLQDVVFALTRVVFAFLFACHGAMKLFGAFGGQPMLHSPLMVIAAVLELGGGILIALGLFTRVTAFLLSGEMAVAYFMGHFPGGFWPIVNHGELAVVYCFFFLYMAVRGAGALSIDGLRGKA